MEKNIKKIKVIGGQPLVGEIQIKGYKNSTPKDMVVAMLTQQKCILRNVPKIRDIEIITEMIIDLGGTINFIDENTLEIDCKNLHSMDLDTTEKLTGISRIPTLATGPLLARFGEAILILPGGCNIGARPIDFHVQAFQRMGAHLEEFEKGYKITANKLHGAKIHLDYPSVGATEQILTAAVLAEGVTEISNAAIEPDIMDRILLLQKMGAIISVDTDRVIRITGVESLKGYDHKAMPDRNEVVSWACAAATTNGSIFLRGANQMDVMTFLNKFRQAGGSFEVKNDGILFERGNKLTSVAIETDVHPGFMTDWQQPFLLMMTQAEGASVFHETVYEDRFGYTNSLNLMGAQIQVYTECLGGKFCRFGQKNHKHSAVVTGPTKLHGADIEVPDLRAGFVYVMAALCAEGESNISNVQIIERGYEKFDDKVRSLGGNLINL